MAQFRTGARAGAGARIEAGGRSGAGARTRTKARTRVSTRARCGSAPAHASESDTASSNASLIVTRRHAAVLWTIHSPGDNLCSTRVGTAHNFHENCALWNESRVAGCAASPPARCPRWPAARAEALHHRATQSGTERYSAFQSGSGAAQVRTRARAPASRKQACAVRPRAVRPRAGCVRSAGACAATTKPREHPSPTAPQPDCAADDAARMSADRRTCPEPSGDPHATTKPRSGITGAGARSTTSSTASGSDGVQAPCRMWDRSGTPWISPSLRCDLRSIAHPWDARSSLPVPPARR